MCVRACSHMSKLLYCTLKQSILQGSIAYGNDPEGEQTPAVDPMASELDEEMRPQKQWHARFAHSDHGCRSIKQVWRAYTKTIDGTSHCQSALLLQI